MPELIILSSTGIRRSARLTSKPKQKYGLFAKFSLPVVEACEVYKNLPTFITISNQHAQEINIHFDETLNHYGPMVSAGNK